MAELGTGAVRTVVADNPGPLTLDGSRTYVVGRERCVVIDPGPALANHLDAVEVALGSGLAVAIALTHGHPDHAAGAGELTMRLGAPLAATRRSAEMAALDPPAIELAAGSTIDFDGGELTVVPAPGHSPDHVCYHWRQAEALFTGDVLLGRGSSMIAPPEGDMREYLETLERLRALGSRVIYPGHGPPIEDPAAKIEEYIRHRQARERQVIESLRAGACTAAEIGARVYPELEPTLRPAAEGSVRAHLAKLVAEGRAREHNGRFELAV